jgi:biopolymer transport protein ExbD
MKFREKSSEEMGIDLTPFLDVVFMLLLFFVVSTTLFKGATQLGVQIPEANAKALAKEQNTLEIGVDALGNYYINGQTIHSSEPKKLKTLLSQKIKNNTSLPVILVGDKKAPHQAVVSVLEVAGELGITKIQIVAQQHSKS